MSSDADFASPLDRDALDEYLAEEWKERQGSTIRFYRDFPRFLEAEYPGIHLATDVWKHLLIQSLARSESFDQTHDLVRRLARYREFTTAEAEQVLTIALQNPQVRWIASDSDIRDLVNGLMAIHERKLPPILTAKWRFILEGKTLSFGPVPADEDVAADPDGTGA